MEKLYRISEVAERLGVSAPTVRAWTNQGKIRAIKTLGGQRRIPESELQRVEREMRKNLNDVP